MNEMRFPIQMRNPQSNLFLFLSVLICLAIYLEASVTNFVEYSHVLSSLSLFAGPDLAILP